MSLLVAGQSPQQGLRQGAAQPGLFVVPKPSPAALGTGVSSWPTVSGFVCHSPGLSQLSPAMSELSQHLLLLPIAARHLLPHLPAQPSGMRALVSSSSQE